MKDLEHVEKEILAVCNVSIDDLIQVKDEELISRWTFKYENVDANSYLATKTMVVIKSTDEVIFQSNVKSKNKHTRGSANHLRVKVEGFDSSGLRIFEFNTGTVGIYCGQDEIRQHKKTFSGSFKNVYTVAVTFLACRYRGC